MASTEALQQFDRRGDLRAKAITIGVQAVERYLSGSGEPVETDPSFRQAMVELSNAAQQPGYQSFGESLD